MNTGLFGEGFPYSNFHDLNMDWIIKIAKDFLDQYTHIQQIIEEGEQSITDLTEEGQQSITDLTDEKLLALQNKAIELQSALQTWYDEHSEDISDQLADAIQSINTKLTETINFFDQHADAKYEELIESLPDNFTDLVNLVNEIKEEVDLLIENTYNLWINPSYNQSGIILTQNKDGSVHVSGTPTSEALFIDYYYDNPIGLNAYTLSITKTGTMSDGMRLGVCTRNQNNTGTQIIYLNGNETYNEITLATNPARCEIILFGDTTYDCDLYIQLELGTIAKSYIPPLTAIDYYARVKFAELRTEYLYENHLVRDLQNFTKAIEITNKSKITKWGLSSGVIDHQNKSVHYSLETASNGGFQTESFSTNSLVLQVTELSFDISIVTGTVRTWLWGTDKTGGTYANVIGYPTEGHNTITLDFSSLQVYSTLDTSKPIKIMFTNGGSEVSDFTVSNLVLKSLVTAQGYIPEYQSAKMYEALDNIVKSIPDIPENTFLTSPNGDRWMLTIDNAGNLGTKSITPLKSAFIGNSLIAGWSTFGMSALDNEHDYYYHVTNKISTIKPTATFHRLSNGNLEHSENQNDFETAFNAIKPYLTQDIELIVIQLGDNVNTNAKYIQFTKQGGSFDTMINWMRTNCPNSRIIWVGTWYPTLHDWLVTACKNKKIEFVDILPLSTYSNKARLGQVVHRTENHSQTLTGTYTISGTSLIINITIYNNQYTITIPSYDTVQNNGNGTFTMTAPYTVIDSTGVQSHPSNDGMKAIADAILKTIGLD